MSRFHLALFLAGCVLAAEPASSSAVAEASGSLIYEAPGGIVFTVTAEGLSAIRVGDRLLADGHWTVFNAEYWFKDTGNGAVNTKEPVEQSIEVLGPRHARVCHIKGDVVCTFDYTFEGEDLLISSRIENNHPDAPMNVAGFRGLTFHFDRPPDGLMVVQHISYFQHGGVELCHPGYWAKFGGSYATDDTVGVGTSPWRTGLMRTLTLWDYASWAADKRKKSPDRRLLYFAVAPVPPRGARTFDFRLRVSRNRDWQHLLARYREHFRATFGPVRYRADYRWIASDYMNKSQQAISPTNPYGFHDGARRIDTPEGVAKFCDSVLPVVQEYGGQGVIMWGQGGDEPRGAMYRPDFDVLPPEVEENWPTLAERFAKAKVKLGVCTRPRHLAVRRDWRWDAIIDINPDDPRHRDMLWRRFENMMKKGCTLFYLDSFGSSFEDVQLMQFLREKMGPEILTFAEHQCDAIMPYSGGYSETTFVGAKGDAEPYYRVWSGMHNWEIFQYLCPESQLISRLYRIQGEIPETFEPVDRFYFRNRITPLLPVSDFRRAAQLGTPQREFLDATGRWR